MRSSFTLNDCRLQAGITDWETAGREDERLEQRADDRCSDGGMDNGKQTPTNKEGSDKQIVSHLRGETHEACLKIKALQRRRRDINSEAS